MLQSLLITDHRAAAELLARAIRQSGEINLEQILCPAPTHYQLSRALNTLTLDVAFVDATGDAAMIAGEIAKRSSRTAIVSFSVDQAAARHSLAAAPDLAWPFSDAELRLAVRRAVRAASGASLRNLFCVIPAKGGVGATTVAVNLACHLANSLGKRVLAAEADLRSGTITDWLMIKAAQSIGQTLTCADSCVSLIWPRHVANKYGVDWMLTNREPNLPQPHWSDYRHLLTFASARYDYAVVDLPRLLENDASEIALLASKVFVVTTPEMLSVRLAHQRISELEAFGVPRPRIEVLVNRVQRGDALGVNQIREALGCEIGGAFPNDYPTVSKSILSGSFVDRGTKLGRAYGTFAAAIAGNSRPPLEYAEKPSVFGFLTSPRRATVRV